MPVFVYFYKDYNIIPILLFLNLNLPTMNRLFFRTGIVTISLYFAFLVAAAQEHRLKPGFDKNEYADMLKMAYCTADTPWVNNKMVPAHYLFAYRSPVTGLDNRWDLWISNNHVAVISIRGTTGKTESWLENFYAAMVPATGSMMLDKKTTFSYSLSDNPRSSVHAGWLMATGYISAGVLSKIDSCYKLGIEDFIITGHSQGGGISYLLTAWLRNLQKNGRLPGELVFKTYSSAAPKPGNLYFAYDYERSTYGGWAFNVVNSADWVPETPVSIQSLSDFNNVNPFSDAKESIRKQPFPTRTAMRYAFRKLERPSRRAVKNYRKYLGQAAGKFVSKSLPEYQAPEYLYGNHYVRTGTTIVLYADQDYYLKFPDNSKNKFIHHMAEPYFYLLKKLKD